MLQLSRRIHSNEQTPNQMLTVELVQSILKLNCLSNLLFPALGVA